LQTTIDGYRFAPPILLQCDRLTTARQIDIKQYFVVDQVRSDRRPQRILGAAQPGMLVTEDLEQALARIEAIVGAPA